MLPTPQEQAQATLNLYKRHCHSQARILLEDIPIPPEEKEILTNRITSVFYEKFMKELELRNEVSELQAGIAAYISVGRGEIGKHD